MIGGIRGFHRWMTRSGIDPDRKAPIEAIVLRSFGLVTLALLAAESIGTKPQPSFHGRGAVALIAAVGVIVAGLAVRPARADVPTWQRIAALASVTAFSGLLAVVQAN